MEHGGVLRYFMSLVAAGSYSFNLLGGFLTAHVRFFPSTNALHGTFKLSWNPQTAGNSLHHLLLFHPGAGQSEGS